MSGQWDAGSVFNADELRSLRNIYDDIASASWFSASPAAHEQFALYILHMHRRGMVDPATLRALCMVAARRKFAKDSFAGKLDGQRILVVEDDFLIADYMVRSLTREGATVVGPAGSIDSAIRLLKTSEQRLAGALLDIRLEDSDVFPLADSLRASRVPFAFVSAYDDRIPARFTDVRRFSKPANPHEIVDFLASR